MPNTNTPSTLLLLPGLSGRPKSLFFRSFNQPMVTLHETRQLEPSRRTKSRWPEPAPVAMPRKGPRKSRTSATGFRGRYAAILVRRASGFKCCFVLPSRPVYLPLAELNCGPGVAEAVEDLWIIPRHSDSSCRTIMMRPSGRQNGFTPREYPELLQEQLFWPTASSVSPMPSFLPKAGSFWCPYFFLFLFY
ncbi:hypothetical protein V8C40DRAFT_112287 [Trichoderma camerunense]